MASRSMNKVMIIGNLTRDPELKYTPSGTAVATFSVATNRSWVTAEGQTKDDVQYHRIIAWQKLAELCSKLLTKGKKVYLEGRITYRNFVGKDGTQRSLTEIVMDDFILFSDGGNRGEYRRPEEHSVATSHHDSYLPPAENDMEQMGDINHIQPEPNTAKAKPSEDIAPEDIPF